MSFMSSIGFTFKTFRKCLQEAHAMSLQEFAGSVFVGILVAKKGHVIRHPGWGGWVSSKASRGFFEFGRTHGVEEKNGA